MYSCVPVLDWSRLCQVLFILFQLTCVRVNNVFNDFVMLANTQFVENVSRTRYFSSVILQLTNVSVLIRWCYKLNKKKKHHKTNNNMALRAICKFALRIAPKNPCLVCCTIPNLCLLINYYINTSTHYFINQHN